jgi:rubrerythrin
MKQYKQKELVCRRCGIFLDSEELVDGNCPSCENDEDVFVNDLED